MAFGTKYGAGKTAIFLKYNSNKLFNDNVSHITPGSTLLLNYCCYLEVNGGVDYVKFASCNR